MGITVWQAVGKSMQRWTTWLLWGFYDFIHICRYFVRFVSYLLDLITEAYKISFIFYLNFLGRYFREYIYIYIHNLILCKRNIQSSINSILQSCSSIFRICENKLLGFQSTCASEGWRPLEHSKVLLEKHFKYKFQRLNLINAKTFA